MRSRRLTLSVAGALIASATAILVGCTSAPQSGEKSARTAVRDTGAALIEQEGRPALPVLQEDSSPDDYVHYAVLNHPGVAAAYYDWRASVEDIAPTRALPDPMLTFQADVVNTLMGFMPGLMFDLMGPSKRDAMARVATAGANVTRQAYIAAVLRAATEARKAWVELAYVEQVDQLYATTINAANQALDLTNAAYVTGNGMGTFDQQIKFENFIAQHTAFHAGISDRRAAARARFKSALGITYDAPDPIWPHPVLVASYVLSADELWHRAAANNADLAKMRAMVEMTVAAVGVARQTGRPNFAVGGMVDLKANPLMFRPAASLSLPIWRDKIAASIAAAEARRDAAIARVSAEQLNLAAELAQMLYMVREADRMLEFIDGTALPNIERSFATLEVGAQSGMTSATMLAETHLMELDLRHERLELLRQRETNAVDLALLVANVAPASSPLPTDDPNLL